MHLSGRGARVYADWITGRLFKPARPSTMNLRRTRALTATTRGTGSAATAAAAIPAAEVGSRAPPPSLARRDSPEAGPSGLTAAEPLVAAPNTAATERSASTNNDGKRQRSVSLSPSTSAAPTAQSVARASPKRQRRGSANDDEPEVWPRVLRHQHPTPLQ